MYRVIVLDYCTKEVRIYNLDTEPEDAEAWLYDHDSNYVESQCSYMCGYGITIHEEQA